MSLKSRLNRIEAHAGWLRYDGWLLLCERQLQVLDLKERYDQGAARREREAAWAEERVRMARRRPPAPDPERVEDPTREPQFAAPVDAMPFDGGPFDVGPFDAGPLEGGPIEAGPIEGEPTQGGPIEAVPTEPAPPSPPYTGIPDHMMVAPVYWRHRTAADDRYDSGHDYSRCLTEYDPMADEDEN